MKIYQVVCGAALVALTFGVVSRPMAAEAPQEVDTQGLPKLGDDWKDTNPFGKGSKEYKTAVEVGAHAYNQNCARCHGLEMISGGIAPDLRKMPLGEEGDDIFKTRMQKGATRNGVMMMPVFGGLLPQETLWAVRSFMVSKHIDE